MITSPSNPKIKEAVRLREGKHRRRTGRFLIDGLREIQRASQSGIRFSEIFVLEEQFDQAEKIRSEQPDCSLYPVDERVFEKLSFGNRQEGMVVVAEIPDNSLKRFDARIRTILNPLIGVLEKIEKPGNVGAIFRSADGAGLDGIMIVDPLADLFNPNTIRSSLGTVFRISATCLTSTDAIAWLRKRDISLVAARCDGAIPYTGYDYRKPTAIILGNEADGLSDSWRGDDLTAISLPMSGIADSLNVSNAAAVLFYEAWRQRQASADR